MRSVLVCCQSVWMPRMLDCLWSVASLVWERVGGSLVVGARRGSKTCGWMMDGRAGLYSGQFATSIWRPALARASTLPVSLPSSTGSVSREYPRSTNRVPASRSRTRHASSNCQVLFSSTDAISFHAVSGGLRVRKGPPGWPPHSSRHISRPLAPYSVMQRPLTSS